ncbi:hypothetical protein IFO70_37815 [Phormidium tenue FACHB-886]|nr:hypothetical protein [Phormidium tenue FACHB-886]
MKLHSSTFLFVLFGVFVFVVAHSTIAADLVTEMPLIAQTNLARATAGLRTIISFCIIFGGLLTRFKNQGFVLPGRYFTRDGENKFSKVRLDILADLLVGVGGGIFIFLLVPDAGDDDLIIIHVKDMGTEIEASFLPRVIALAPIEGACRNQLI